MWVCLDPIYLNILAGHAFKTFNENAISSDDSAHYMKSVQFSPLHDGVHVVLYITPPYSNFIYIYSFYFIFTALKEVSALKESVCDLRLCSGQKQETEP